MGIVSNGSLMDTLRQYALLPPHRLAELPSLIQGRCGDVRTLARLLLQRDWLTVYQANQLLAGHAADLRFGPYLILDRLGQGGQSLVFKARHQEHGCTVALKVIRSELASHPDAAEQFVQEMEAMARLDHPNVVEFWDADLTEDTFYCAMEFIEGTDLCKVVGLTGVLPPHQAADYVRQTALGLQHAFEHNLVHRDIKPQNLFLTAPARGEPIVKILDWGLACLRPPDGGGVTQNPAKAVIGTADYLSPEQARNANSVDIRSDIYSLGCTFYYFLTGQPPFPGGTLLQKLIQHKQADPTPVETVCKDVPPGLAAILRRAMCKRPEERFQTPAALAIALRPYCRAITAAPGLAASTTRPPAGKPLPRVDDNTPMPAPLLGSQHGTTRAVRATPP